MVSTLLLSVLLIIGCERDNIEPVDNLSKVGLLGLWRLEMRTVDGISGLAA